MAEFITFFGGDSNTGTTLLAAAFAAEMTAQNKKVLFLSASQEADEGWFSNGAGGFGSLLRLEAPSSADLASAVSNGKGRFAFDCISPAKDILNRQFYRPQLIKAIRLWADRSYDLIVADAGSDATLPLPAACLAWADRRCYVLTGSAKGLVRFETVFRTVLKGLALDWEKDLLVLNKAGESPLHARLSHLTDAFGLKGFSVPFSEDGHSWELNPQDAFRKEPQAGALKELAEALTAKAGA